MHGSMYKTVTLGGAEQEIKITGRNCDIRNDGTEIIYASTQPEVVAGADGVLSVPVGQAARLRCVKGTVYLLGTGTALLCGHDYSEQVFKCAPAAGGGGTEDTVARNAITALTADVTDNAAGIALLKGSVSNDNLLINPDFAINQRGKNEYTGTSYSVDMWKCWNSKEYSRVSILDEGVRCERISDDAAPSHCIIKQDIAANIQDFTGRMTVSWRLLGSKVSAGYFVISARFSKGDADTYIAAATIKVEANGMSGVFSKTIAIPVDAERLRVEIDSYGPLVGDYVDVAWVKLENSATATPFTPPEPTTELEKCQRYYQVRTTGDIDPIDLRPSMAEITDIVEREDGNYAYIAEL